MLKEKDLRPCERRHASPPVGAQDASPLSGDRPGFRADIAGLRGIAVLLVVAYHVKVPGVSGGFIGVDVFFVLSGYLITYLLVTEIERTGKLDLLQFYARRARRLLPASALVVFATLLASALLLSPLELERVSRTAIATSTYISNFWFLHQSADYFAPASETNPLLHTWSLAVEEQFYFAWPLLILLAFRLGRGRRGLISALALAAAVSFVGCVWLTQASQPWGFYSTPARAWEFALGGIASLIPLAWLRARAAWGPLLGWLGIAAVMLAAARFSESTSFPGASALLPVAGTVAVLVGGQLVPGAGVGRVLNTAPLQRLGQLSYSWYLWHWPALIFAGALIPSMNGPARVAVAFVSLGLAAATYALVENPVRYYRRLTQRPVLSLSLAAVLTTAGATLGLASRGVAVAAIDSPEQRAFSYAATDAPKRFEEAGCLTRSTATGFQECVFGDTTATTTVVLFGDSHAAHWFPPLLGLADRHGWRLVTMTKGQCPAARLSLYHPRLKRRYAECEEFREAALRRIDELRASVVLLSNSKIYVNGYDRRGGISQFDAQTWGAGMRRTLVGLDSAGIEAILLHDSPRMPESVPICLSRAAFHRKDAAQACGLERDLALDLNVIRAERAAAQGLEHVLTLDLSEQFCEAGFCAAMRNGMVIYRDEDHLTASFADQLAPVLQTVIMSRLSRQGG